MLRNLIFVGLLLQATLTFGQSGSSQDWDVYQTAESAGFSKTILSEAKELYDSIGSASLMVIKSGKVVAAWGDYDREFIIHSCRKSFISALYGIYIDKGLIDPNETLQSLNLNHKTPLTEVEEKARIIDLLRARSGVYIPAGAEAPHMKKTRPERGSHEPGSFWYYNNWDFNVLGTIFKLKTGKNVFEALKEDVFDKIGGQDFDISDGYFGVQGGEYADHPPYIMKMSARDMAKFGWLFANNGKWGEEQIIPQDWIVESTSAYTPELNAGYQGMGGYGYMWWVPKGRMQAYGAYEAAGAGGHYITVLPKLEMVIVHRANTYGQGMTVNDGLRRKLYDKILDAAISEPLTNASFNKLPSDYWKNMNTDFKGKDDLLGVYEFEFGEGTILEKNGKAYFNLPFRVFDYEIAQINDSTFHTKDLGFELVKRNEGDQVIIDMDFTGLRKFRGTRSVQKK